ncbi:MAG: response regulator [Elainellaceae cyanobacterium]
MVGSRTFQKLHPIGLLALMVRRNGDGCLKVSNEVASWLIYIEESKLVYATNSIAPLDRLHQHFQELKEYSSLIDIPSRAITLLFKKLEHVAIGNAEYQVICKLVQHHYITPKLAGRLVETLTKEVLESFLTLREGNYEVIQDVQFKASPKFCYLDICKVLEICRPSPQPSPPFNQTLEQKSSPIHSRHHQIDSEAKVGRSPSLVLPQPLPEPDKPPPPPSASQGQRTPHPLKKSRYVIVCIDDSPSVLRKIKSFFDQKTFSVLTISDPMNALMQIIRCKPDLILLDVNMPNLNGYELCSLLRRHSSFRKTPVIMVTGKTGFLDRTKAKLIGTSGYLTKPFTKAELIKEVFMHLD